MKPFTSSATASSDGLVELADLIRIDAARALDSERQSEFGQFFTPARVASLMASMSTPMGSSLRLLDAGAGSGMLTAAWVAHACSAWSGIKNIRVVAYERDEELHGALRRTLELCKRFSRDSDIDFSYEICGEDFIEAAVAGVSGDMFAERGENRCFTHAVLNPPYGKLRTRSNERRLLRKVGADSTNLYTGFVSMAIRLLAERGELVAITPRSFCNGPYFTSFRRDLLEKTSLTNLHIFDSRNSAFEADGVLQENLIFRVVRENQAPEVVVEWSEGGGGDHTTERVVPFTQVVRPNDSDLFIHVTPDEWGSEIAAILHSFQGNLQNLRLGVSTGRVVDFRVKESLRQDHETGAAPLLYPSHLQGGSVRWPQTGGKKPNSLLINPKTERLLNKRGTYVLVKRFSSKEERRRVVATVICPKDTETDFVAFENHLNYFHRDGEGIPAKLAWGLAAYLNSTIVDSYFRQFNGHTQVNATDLRKLPYPLAEQLDAIGERIGGNLPDQDLLDVIVEEELLGSEEQSESGVGRARIEETCSILEALGLPRRQTNERAALTLLALVDLPPDRNWSEAANPLLGVTPIMEFAAEFYGKQWKPNTRETVRRQTLHQFRDAGVVVSNPDNPERPVNSPAYCYQVPDSLLSILRTFGTSTWERNLNDYLASRKTLISKYARIREMARIPLVLEGGREISLSPGGQNHLIAEIVKKFCPRFTPGAIPIYIGDADSKWAHFNKEILTGLGVELDPHGKMPDVLVHYSKRNWLVIIEAVTSHGPIDPKRRGELRSLFGASKAPLVYVTAFESRQALNKYLPEIAWETEVWVADAPSHLIHFNGERFLGPYDS